MTLNTRTWLFWLFGMTTLIMLNRNPLYTLILLLITQIVSAVCALPAVGLRLPLARIMIVVLIFSMIFNALSVHIGQTVLFRLPTNWPLIGGAITLEAAVFGVSNGLTLVTLLALFTTFNQVVRSSDLVRLTPRALHHLGIILLIAITYVPETNKQWQRIRDAQAIRGHQLHGWRDWRPIAIPLLIGGLERAMNLAEAMVARGYGTTKTPQSSLKRQIALLGSLFFTFVGWILLLWGQWMGWLLLLLGTTTMLRIIRQLGQQHPYTQYQPQSWTRWDALVITTAVVPLLLTPFTTLNYTPYPQLTLPPFHIPLGLTLLLFLTPALVTPQPKAINPKSSIP